jgi:dihydrodipicolinate synthase/N-acetylneuraminate lyase
VSYTASELRGICAMMPAFSTEDAADITATQTVAVENLTEGVDRMIEDGGADLIATTGSFGQCYNLFWEEFQTLVRATIEVVNKRVPLMVGVTSANPRETYQKIKFVREAGGEGVLVGLPYYAPIPIRDIPTFYRTLSELFPDLSIMVYHNPENHRVHMPVPLFRDLVKLPNVVAMKDGRRETREFMDLHDIIHGKISDFVHIMQMYPFYEMGAAGCWSYHAWQGPWPVMALRDAAVAGDAERQRAITDDLRAAGVAGRPTELADYVSMGPPRPPFSWIDAIPDEAAKNTERAKKQLASWSMLNDKYRPQVQPRRVAVNTPVGAVR